MTHEHDFVKDLDGQVTCSMCGAMDDDKQPQGEGNNNSEL